MPEVVFLTFLIFAVALLYSSVGQAGGSGYLAVMAIFGVSAGVMKPSALVLNVLVAGVATARSQRAGCVSARLFVPFAAIAAPFAAWGGTLALPGPVYSRFVGIFLGTAALTLLRGPRATESSRTNAVPMIPALATGVAIGMLSGLTGIGGGISLGPLLPGTGWAGVRESAGVSAAFNLSTSVAGIVGHLSVARSLPPAIPYLAVAAVVGGTVGSGLGSRRLGDAALRRLLGIVLVIAGVKLMLPP